MKLQLTLLSFVGLALRGLLVGACNDHTHARRHDSGHGHDDDHGNPKGHDHGHPTPPKPPPLTPPSRALEWGDINIIHTTDSHGWLLGHQKSSFPEPNYSGDLGDFASFVTHMKEIADKRKVDLLLIDSGDLHDGTGLSDGFPPGGIDAHDANQFLKLLPYDLMTIGNHELYIYENALDMHQNFAPALKGRYLSSNVNITVADRHGSPVSVPVGERFVKFKTKHGRKITALGVLYNFKDNDRNTTVQRVADMVNEAWFHEAIREEPDVFLLTGHMAVDDSDWTLAFNAVRAVHKTTPILILGGHFHRRNCLQLDGHSMSLESGRYMETVGWMSAKLDKRQDVKFSRRYLDTNRVTYEFHSQRSERDFDTSLGKRITEGLHQLAERFDLTSPFGTAPLDYFLSSVPYPSNNSLLSLFIEQATPLALKQNNSRASNPAFFVTNSGSMRFDLYAGPFTRDDQFTVSPFTDSFLYLPDIPLSLATQTLNALNNDLTLERRSDDLAVRHNQSKRYSMEHVDHIFRKWLKEMDRRDGIEKRAANNLTLGYTTKDACPGVGDDIPHAPIPLFDPPFLVASKPPPDIPSDGLVDFVFVDFVESDLLDNLNGLQTEKVYTTSDAQRYSDVLANAILGVYAQAAWN